MGCHLKARSLVLSLLNMAYYRRPPSKRIGLRLKDQISLTEEIFFWVTNLGYSFTDAGQPEEQQIYQYMKTD